MKLRDKKGRFLKGIQSNENGQFKKGQIPWNKGLKMSNETFEKIKHTLFNKGHIPSTMKHFGKPYLSVSKNKKTGYIEKTWFIHIDKKRKYYLKYLCEQNGIDLTNKIARLKSEHQIDIEPTIEDIIIITRSENMRLNSYVNYPAPIRKLMQVKGALNRQINKKL